MDSHTQPAHPRPVSSVLVRERLHSRVVGRDEHWDRPYAQGTSQSRVVSESSESTAQAALQGLTCEKKTESILVKAADLYSE